jgi:hypothetical protein
MDQPTLNPIKKASLFKKWWLWVIVAGILAAVFFIPYIKVLATCMPCPESASSCPACPTYQQNLYQYLTE